MVISYLHYVIYTNMNVQIKEYVFRQGLRKLLDYKAL